MTMISDGRYACAYVTVHSSSDGALLSDPQFVCDGAPTTQTAFRWPSGAQTTAVYLDVVWRVSPAPSGGVECRAWCIDGLDGVPVGAKLRLLGGATSSPATTVADTVTVRLPSGRVGAWVIRGAGGGATHEFYAWRIFNDVSGASPIAASSTVLVGEVFAAPVEEWPAAELSTSIVDASLVEGMSDGSVRRVKRMPYRKIEIKIPPQSRATAFVGDASLQGLAYRLIGADVVAVIPLPRERGSSAVQSSLANAMGYLATPDLQSVEIASAAGTDAWPVAIRFRESL